MKTILVTGASGFLGGALDRLLDKADRVLAAGFRHAEKPLDLRVPEALRRLLDSARPDIVVHTAAYRDPDFCEAHPDEARRLNTDPVRVLAGELPPRARLVLISTDYVFDGTAPPYREDSARHPLSVYGRTKADAEDLALARPNSLVIRIPLLIGIEPAHRGPAGFILEMARQVLGGQPVEVDDRLVRSPTWTEDVAEAVRFLLDRGASGLFHFSGPRSATRYAWTLETAALMGRSAGHVRPSRGLIKAARRPADARLDTGKIRALGFTRFTDFTVVARQVLEKAGWPGKSE